MVGTSKEKRIFKQYEPTICYNKPPSAQVDPAEYESKRLETLSGKIVETLIVPKCTARTWTMQAGDLCRITVCEGSQTRQLHSTHLKVYDRIWSNFPYLRPMATLVHDTLADYGIDEHGGALHDVVGTRCDDYTYKLITGKDRVGSCHSSLTKAVIQERGMKEEDVHDVWNIFMCTGFTRDTQQYFCKPSPARKGDYLEFIAEINLLIALSACPQGDVSVVVGEEVPDEICHPLKVEIFRKSNNN
ncbi:PREDICTED: uncharacterized protein C11D3.03c-like isoform X3 [Bactrocera latifrons]|nr:PREDICTED: uncharacterized protein C11D3.03c-like isoform X3 [Bactrocera latifrons]